MKSEESRYNVIPSKTKEYENNKDWHTATAQRG